MTAHTGAEDRAPLVRFLETLKKSKDAQPLLETIRVVSKGLFVDSRSVSAIVELYHAWLLKESAGSVDKPVDKCFQWLFEGREPERLYVIEGKKSLVGHVIPIPLTVPQQFGLPFYLGSLLSADTYLHPSDPEIAKLSKVEVRHGKLGAEFVVSTRGARIAISEQMVKAFAQLAKTSRFMERRYPESTKSLVGALTVLVALLKRSRPLSRHFPIVVPYDVRNSKTKNVRMAGKFMFIEEKGTLLRILELNGRNLSDFLRQELTKAPRDKLGSFKLTPKHRDLMGFYEAFGRRRSVHARAFAEFEEAIRRTRDTKERFAGFFSATECFEKFSSYYQLSQPIEVGKIRGALERHGVSGHSFQLYGGWIFVFDTSQTIVRVVAKHIRLVGLSKR
jgi:hypothetical protein